MTTIRLKSSSLKDANLSLSASQSGASDSGSATGWGSGGAGTLNVNVDRSVLQTAPDSVRFEVDLSQTTFDTEAIPSWANWSAPYDDRLVGVIFLWDFGETRNYTAPTNIHPNWVSARYAKGPWVAHCYHPDSISGDWQDFFVYCKAYEPASGKTATWSTTIRVYHPDYTYGGSRPGYTNVKTYYVNPNGDSDFSAAPSTGTYVAHLELDGTHGAAANTFNETITAWTTERTAGNYVRWLFKRGGSYTFGVQIESGEEEFQYFGAYNSGAVPILNAVGTMLHPKSAWTAASGLPEMRVIGLYFDGGFDPATDSFGVPQSTGGGPNPNPGGVDSSFLRCLAAAEYVVQDVTVRGMWDRHIEASSFQNANNGIHLHVDNVLMHEFCCASEYNIHLDKYSGPNNWENEATMALTGFAHIAPPAGPSRFANLVGGGAETAWHHGMGRINWMGRLYVRSSDFFHQGNTNGVIVPHAKSEGDENWAQVVTDGSEDYVSTFPPLYPPDGAIINIHSSSFEGAVGTIGRAHPDTIWGQPVYKYCGWDECLFVGGLYTGSPGTFYGSGFVMRNCYHFFGSRTSLPTGDWGYSAMASYNTSGFFHRGRVAPFRIYNCTALVLLTSAQNGSSKLNVIRSGRIGAFGTTWYTFNNIMSGPNFSVAQTNEVENLDYWDSDIDMTSTLSWFTHRTIGETVYDGDTNTMGTTVTTYVPLEANPYTAEPLNGSTITDASTSTELTNGSVAPPSGQSAYIPPYAPFGKSIADMIANPASGVFDKRGCWAEQAA